MNIITVSSLNEQIKNLLESHFQTLYVEGEVSRPTYHTSGHLYFSLKDAQSVVRCVMFRSSLAKVPFRVEDGQKLIVVGRIGVYKPEESISSTPQSSILRGRVRCSWLSNNSKRDSLQKGISITKSPCRSSCAP